jgi:uncharacterized membrane protein
VRPVGLTSTEKIHLVLAGTVGALVRAVGLSKQPLWLDEAVTARFATRPILDCALAEPNHPPLFRVLLHMWLAVFGDSDAAVRALPALLGTLLLPVVFGLCKRLWPRRAVWVMWSLALSPMAVFFSQEGRKYALLMLLGAASTWAYLRFAQEREGLALHAVLSALGLWTHAFFGFVFLTHELAYWRLLREEKGRWGRARAATLLSIVPWLLWAVPRLGSQERSWIGAAWARLPYAVLRDLVGYGLAAADHARRTETAWQIVSAEAIWTLPPLLVLGYLFVRGAVRAFEGPLSQTLLAGLLVVPPVVLALASPWVNLVHERYLSFQLPFVFMVVGMGMGLSSRPWQIAGFLALIWSLAVQQLSPGALGPYAMRYGKENWRAVAAAVAAHPVDEVRFVPDHLRVPFERYGQVPAPRKPGRGPRTVALVFRGLDDEKLPGCEQTAEAVFPEQTGVLIRTFRCGK